MKKLLLTIFFTLNVLPREGVMSTMHSLIDKLAFSALNLLTLEEGIFKNDLENDLKSWKDKAANLFAKKTAERKKTVFLNQLDHNIGTCLDAFHNLLNKCSTKIDSFKNSPIKRSVFISTITVPICCSFVNKLHQKIDLFYTKTLLTAVLERDSYFARKQKIHFKLS